MKLFRCECGQRIFFENLHCTRCGRKLGFDSAELRLLALEPGTGPGYLDPAGNTRAFCKNHDDYQVCNWLLPAGSAGEYCFCCQRNLVVPNLDDDRRIAMWGRLEHAKRRLLYTLLSLGLPADGLGSSPMTFRFLEDRRTNALVEEDFVETGYQNGTITINLAEADDSVRHAVREGMQERYRTLLGHFRHESGHFYFEWATRGAVESFRGLFGDERGNYEAAMKTYYENPPSEADWASKFISQYACSHPLEDWAETWAHYLHIVDTLETAAACGIVTAAATPASREWIDVWIGLSVTMNELNRSMGSDDVYPFVLSGAVAEKLAFIHRRVERMAAEKAVSVNR